MVDISGKRLRKEVISVTPLPGYGYTPPTRVETGPVSGRKPRGPEGREAAIRPGGGLIGYTPVAAPVSIPGKTFERQEVRTTVGQGGPLGGQFVIPGKVYQEGNRKYMYSPDGSWSFIG